MTKKTKKKNKKIKYKIWWCYKKKLFFTRDFEFCTRKNI